MVQNYTPRPGSGGIVSGEILRRDFLAGSLTASAALFSGSGVWAQSGATIPLHCVPPLPLAQAIAFNPAPGPVRVRKSVFELDAGEITRLKSAYAALRNLAQHSPDDPRGWYHQGQVHCWYCTGAVDALNGMEIHGGWWFLAWHRAYLYFHEQILGTLIGDPTFALPYWDWDSSLDKAGDTSGRNRFPGEVYGFSGDTGNPLYNPTRAAGPNDRIPPIYVGPSAMKPIINAANFTDFGGSGNEELAANDGSQGNPRQMGQLEGGPHGGVHLWTTDPSFAQATFGAPDMGSLASAGFDPVFFAHHANIDRLWDVWIKNNAHANPANDGWLGQPFFFYDQAQAWTGILISQMTDPEGPLSYKYQAPQWPVSGPAVTTAAVAGSARKPLRVAQSPQLSTPIVEMNQTNEIKPLSGATTLQVAVPAQAREKLNAFALANDQTSLVLRIDGVEIPADRGVIVQVFVNRPEIKRAVEGTEPGYVGSIVVVPAMAAGALHLHGTVSRNFGFALSAELGASLRALENISVTLVPVTKEGDPPAKVLGYRRVYLATR